MLCSTLIDDFGLAKLSAENRRDLLEITEDRYGIRSTVITSQLPVENWHDIVGDPDPRRRHPRPTCAQLLPAQLERRIDAKKTPTIDPN